MSRRQALARAQQASAAHDVRPGAQVNEVAIQQAKRASEQASVLTIDTACSKTGLDIVIFTAFCGLLLSFGGIRDGSDSPAFPSANAPHPSGSHHPLPTQSRRQCHFANIRFGPSTQFLVPPPQTLQFFPHYFIRSSLRLGRFKPGSRKRVLFRGTRPSLRCRVRVPSRFV